MNKRISDLSTLEEPDENDKILISHGQDIPMAMTITVRQLLGMQQKELRRKCLSCGTVGSYDMRGNCGACGHPFED